MRFTRFAVAAFVAAASLAGGQSAGALSAEPCPAGYYGVIVEHEGRQTSVCTNLAHLESCPSGIGTVVWVSGRYISACVAK